MVKLHRVLEYGRGNIMTKANLDDVSLRTVKQGRPETFVSHDWRKDASVSISKYDDILFKGKKVGDILYTTRYDAVMDDDYDSDDKEFYINTEFDYVNDGDMRDCHIDRLDIEDAWQNLGIGTAILTKYFRGATLSPDNKDARNLYSRIGHEYRGNDDGILNLDAGFGVYEID
jgi:hypothetical protein